MFDAASCAHPLAAVPPKEDELAALPVMEMPQVPLAPPPVVPALLPSALVIVVAKLGSSPSASASSLSVSSVPGADATKFVISVRTNAVVATVVLFVPAF